MISVRSPAPPMQGSVSIGAPVRSIRGQPRLGADIRWDELFGYARRDWSLWSIPEILVADFVMIDSGQRSGRER
jgi:hypothetical protein